MALSATAAAPASELPVPRALHTLTRVGHRFVVIGGQGETGPVPDVQLLECPAVTRGLQLQRQHMDGLSQLASSKQRCSQLSADLVCRTTELQESRRRLQVSSWEACCMLLSHGLQASYNFLFSKITAVASCAANRGTLLLGP